MVSKDTSILLFGLVICGIHQSLVHSGGVFSRIHKNRNSNKFFINRSPGNKEQLVYLPFVPISTENNEREDKNVKTVNKDHTEIAEDRSGLSKLPEYKILRDNVLPENSNKASWNYSATADEIVSLQPLEGLRESNAHKIISDILGSKTGNTRHQIQDTAASRISESENYKNVNFLNASNAISNNTGKDSSFNQNKTSKLHKNKCSCKIGNYRQGRQYTNIDENFLDYLFLLFGQFKQLPVRSDNIEDIESNQRNLQEEVTIKSAKNQLFSLRISKEDTGQSRTTGSGKQKRRRVRNETGTSDFFCLCCANVAISRDCYLEVIKDCCFGVPDNCCSDVPNVGCLDMLEYCFLQQECRLGVFGHFCEDKSREFCFQVCESCLDELRQSCLNELRQSYLNELRQSCFIIYIVFCLSGHEKFCYSEFVSCLHVQENDYSDSVSRNCLDIIMNCVSTNGCDFNVSKGCLETHINCLNAQECDYNASKNCSETHINCLNTHECDYNTPENCLEALETYLQINETKSLDDNSFCEICERLSCCDIPSTCLHDEPFSRDTNIPFEADTAAEINVPLIQLLQDNHHNPDKNLESLIFTLAAPFASCEVTDLNLNILMVRKCPKKMSDNSLRKSCENSNSTFLPPVTARHSGVELTFKNYFCAICHGFDNSSLIVWQTALKCQYIPNEVSMLTIYDLDNFVNRGICLLTFTAPKKIIEHVYCKNTTYSVNVGGSGGSIDRCELDCSCCTYTAGIFQKCKCCSHQSSKESDSEMCGEQELVHYSLDLAAFSRIDNYQGGILIILDISGKRSQVFYKCRDQDVINPFTLECTQLICSPWSIPYRGTCYSFKDKYFMKNSTQIFPNKWNSLVAMWTAPKPQIADFCSKLDRLITNVNILIEKIEINGSILYQQSEDNNSFCPDNWENVSNELNLKVSIKIFDIMFITRKKINDILNDTQIFDKTISNISITNMEDSKYRKNCSNGARPRQRENFYFEDNRGIEYAVVNFTHVRIYYPFDTIGYKIMYHGSPASIQSGMFQEVIYVCDTSQLFLKKDCDILSLNLSDTEQNNSRLFVISFGRYFEEGDYEIQESQVFVCVELLRSEGKQNTIYLVLSFILTLSSVVFLFLMLVIYCLLPELRTTPGKMTASLAGSMMMTFLFNLFTLVKIRNEYVCPVMAAINHVVTLAHFGWMSAIAVNMALTFRPGARMLPKSKNGSHIFIRYTFIVWGFSVTIVASSVILDFTNKDPSPIPDILSSIDSNESDSTSPSETLWPHFPLTYPSFALSTNYPRYGVPFCTWFSGPLWTRLVFIIVPYFITCFINIIGFILALVGLQRSQKASEKVGRKSTARNQCLIYMKLATTMGFSWILFILVDIYPDSAVLVYTYLCLVLVQGVLLFSAFILNKRVLALIKSRFSPRKQEADSINMAGNCGMLTESSKNNCTTFNSNSC